MSDQHTPQTHEDANSQENGASREHTDGPQVEAQAEQIITDGKEIRERIRSLMLKALRERRMMIAQLGDISRQVMAGAAKAIRDSNQSQHRDTLDQVVEGVEDAFTTATQAARLAYEEAAARGQAFADEDLKRAMQDVKSLEDMFVKTLKETANRFGHELAEQLKDIATHTQRAGNRVSVAVAAALRAMSNDPMGFAKQSAAASAEITRQSTGMFLQAMASVLQAAGEALSDPPQNKDTNKDNSEQPAD